MRQLPLLLAVILPAAAEPPAAVLARWGWPPERFAALEPAARAAAEDELRRLESERERQLLKLRRIAGERWREFVTADERLTPEGLRLIGEQPAGAGSVREPVARARPSLADADSPSGVDAASVAEARGASGNPDLVFDGRLGAAAAVAPRTAGAGGEPLVAPPMAAAPPAPGGGAPPAAVTAPPAAVVAPPVVVAPSGDDSGLPPVGAFLAGSRWVRTAFSPAAITLYSPSQHEQLSFQDRVATHERQSFWRQVKEEVCSNIEIPIKKTFDIGDYVRVKPKWHRWLDRRPPGNEPVLVDKVSGRFGFGASAWEDVVPGGKLYVSGGFEIDGESFVVRPVKVDKSLCELFWRLPDVTDIKTAFALRKERIKAMRVGEVWKLPLALKTTVRAGYGYGVGELTASVSFGYSNKGEQSVKLVREAKDKLIFELKLDQAHVFGPKGELIARLWGSQFDEYRNGTEDFFGEPIRGPKPVLFIRDIDDAVLKMVNRFLSAQLSVMAQWEYGKQGLIVFELNPEDDAQMRALQELLSGGKLANLKTLWEMSRQAAKAYVRENLKPEKLVQLAKDSAAQLKKEPEFVGTRDRRRFAFPIIRLQLGPLFDIGYSEESEKDGFTLLDGSGAKVDLFRGRTSYHRGSGDIPGLGHSRSIVGRETVITVSERRPSGGTDKPASLYVRQLGDNRRPTAEARGDIEDANKLLALVGSGRDAADPRLLLPAAPIFPSLGREKSAGEPAGRWDRYVSAFTLLLPRPAWDDVFQASDAELMRSFGRMMLLRNSKWQQANEYLASRPEGPDFDETALARRFTWHEGELEDFRTLYRRGELFVAHIKALGARVNGEPGAKLLSDRQFAREIDRLLDGPNPSGLKRADMMEILLPLIAPGHVAAEWVVRADGNGGGRERKLAERFVLNPELEVPGLLERAAKLLYRFSPPSSLR